MPIRFLLLRILSHTPMHGYALRRAIEGLQGIFASSNPNLYAILQGMEEDGLVEAERHEVRGRLRKVYSITEQGTRTLDDWLVEPILAPPQVRDEAVMKVALLDGPIPAGVGAWLRTERERMLEAIRDAEAEVKDARTEDAIMLELAIGYAVDVARLRARWLDRVLDAIGDPAAAEDLSPAIRRTPELD